MVLPLAQTSFCPAGARPDTEVSPYEMTRGHEDVCRRALELFDSEPDVSTALGRVVAELKSAFPDYTWVGVYLLESADLVLGPFLGKPSPHTRIPVGQGICGAAAAELETIVVDDVNADDRYLACSLETRSEIVVPILFNGRVVGEFDIDSDRPAAFRQRDRELLERIAGHVAPRVDVLVNQPGAERTPPA